MTDAHVAGDLTTAIRQERLPPGYEAIVKKYYAPLAAAFAKRQTERARPIVVGISGPQGSGKSTLAKFLALLLQSEHDKHVAVLSLDDIYLTKAQRQILANDIHTMFTTRGPPGTHDVNLGCSVLGRLIKAKPDDVTMIPRFDKSTDDRCREDQWDRYKGAPDIILFEGWCVGVRPQPENALTEPVNDLERLEDASGAWRRYVNDAIAQDYPALFNHIDILVYVKPPEFECVFKWRRLQETKLMKAVDGVKFGIMGDSELKRFIMHYERLTRFMMEDLPGRADVVLELDNEQQVVSVV